MEDVRASLCASVCVWGRPFCMFLLVRTVCTHTLSLSYSLPVRDTLVYCECSRINMIKTKLNKNDKININKKKMHQ